MEDARLHHHAALGFILCCLTTQVMAADHVHFAVGQHLGWSPAGTHIESAFRDAGWGGISGGWFGTVEYPRSSQFGSRFLGHAEIELKPRVRLGVHITSLAGIEVKGANLETESAAGTAYGVVLETYQRRVIFRKNQEYAAAAGINWNQVQVKGDMGHVATEPAGNSYSLERKLLGLYLRGTLDQYVGKGVSLQVIGAFCLLPNISVPQKTIGAGYKTLPAHTVNLTTISIGVAIRFHV